jgi:hypothetical protein
MPKQLTTHNAQITTASVEVKTLTISGKQVTLAVFRQLREEPLIAKDGTLNGVPWGTVNYHPDKCGSDHRDHWHVVWQRGNDLLRSRINKDITFGYLYTEDDVCGSYADAWTREYLHGRAERHPLTKDTMSGFGYNDTCRFKFGRVVLEGDVSKVTIAAVQALDDVKSRQATISQYSDTDYQRGLLAEAEEKFRSALAKLDAEVDSWNTTVDELRSKCEAAAKAEVERRQRHRDARDALVDLPQLFIAV